MNVDNSSIESVEVFKYLGTTLTNQNSVQKEIKSRLKLGNACCYSVQNLLSSSLLSKNLKIEIYIELYFYLFNIYQHYNLRTQKSKTRQAMYVSLSFGLFKYC